MTRRLLIRESAADPRMLAEVAEGLAQPQKELSPKYFYDQRGSELFEEITRLEEYYPTRTERGMLVAWMPALIRRLGTRTLVELGAGSAEKTRVILDAMRDAGTAELYVPIDVSASFLGQTAARLRREYPRLLVEPAIADISEELNVPRRVPRPPRFHFPRVRRQPRAGRSSSPTVAGRFREEEQTMKSVFSIWATSDSPAFRLLRHATLIAVATVLSAAVSSSATAQPAFDSCQDDLGGANDQGTAERGRGGRAALARAASHG